MPITRMAAEKGSFSPAELGLMGRVFERLNARATDPAESERIASRIIANYTLGIHDEAELELLSARPLHR